MRGFALLRMNAFTYDNFQMFGTFTITQEDAKAGMCAISHLCRVHRFRDIQVNLYI